MERKQASAWTCCATRGHQLYEAEAGEKTSETVIQKILDELPGPRGEGRIMAL
jgi:hypothetical protein